MRYGRGRPGWITAAGLIAVLAFAGCSGDQALEPTATASIAASPGAHGVAGQPQPKPGMEIYYMEFTIDHHGMSIMMAQMCMEMLAALEGAEFEIEFMETFSRHHHQIVQRSQTVASPAVHAELRQLARDIIQARTTDIRLMLTGLCEWYDICHPRFGSAPG